jgi:DNA replication protein DnaC
MSELDERLRKLGLRATAESLSDLIARATKDRFGAAQLLEHVADLEEQERARRSMDRRLSRSRLGRFKPMADFDWNWPTSIERDRIESALRLDFLADARNIVLVSPQGLGKTMIAQNIAHQAILAGHSVLVVTAAQLLLELGAQESARSLDRKLRHYAKQSLLVIDEVGYLAFDNRNADLLFQVIARRYEKRSVVLTTNLPFREWPSIFPNAACATALIDRVIHHADVLAIEGQSYRLRQAEDRTREESGKTTAPKSPKPKKS